MEAAQSCSDASNRADKLIKLILYSFARCRSRKYGEMRLLKPIMVIFLQSTQRPRGAEKEAIWWIDTLLCAIHRANGFLCTFSPVFRTHTFNTKSISYLSISDTFRFSSEYFFFPFDCSSAAEFRAIVNTHCRFSHCNLNILRALMGAAAAAPVRVPVSFSAIIHILRCWSG